MLGLRLRLRGATWAAEEGRLHPYRVQKVGAKRERGVGWSLASRSRRAKQRCVAVVMSGFQFPADGECGPAEVLLSGCLSFREGVGLGTSGSIVLHCARRNY